MKKYYDLVVSLIKSHKKYVGCEEILEDIINDVYEHAEVILNTVTNESVVTSYLNKIVSTSMITVPKRLGIRTKKECVVVNEPIQEEIVYQNDAVNSAEITVDEIETVQNIAYESETDDSSLEQELQTNTNDEYITNESVNKSDFVIISEEEEDVDDESDIVETDEKEVISDEIETLELNNEFDENDDNGEIVEIEENIINESDYLEISEQMETTDDIPEGMTDEVEEEDISVDKTLVDKMINGSNEFEVNNNEIIIDEDIDSLGITDTDLSEINDVLVEEDSDETNIESIDSEEESQDEIKADEAIIEPIDSEENIEPLIEEFDSDVLIDNMELNENIENVQADNLELKEPENDNIADLSNMYSYFDYTPEKIEIDEKDILSELEELESKNPEKQIKKICELKYKHSMAISEIAKKLGMPNDSVLESLNEIIYAIKD